MKTGLQLLTICLLAQATLSKIQVRLKTRPDDTSVQSGHPGQLAKLAGFDNVLREATAAAENVNDNLALFPAGDTTNSIGEQDRMLLGLFPFILILSGVIAAVVIAVVVIITDPENRAAQIDINIDFNSDGNAEVDIEIGSEYLNEDQTGLCDGCSIEVEAGDCLQGDCDSYDKDAVNLDTVIAGDPHMVGLLGQKIDWFGIDGGWYSLVKDDSTDLHINIRLTAPLPEEFPDRQLITGVAILSEGHSLVVEVKNPYSIHTDGCPDGVSPCLANGGLSIVADGDEVNDLLRFTKKEPVAGGVISVTASNLPVECRPFGGDKIWAEMFEEMQQGRRELFAAQSFEDWILGFDQMAAPTWCAKYIAENDLADLQSIHAIFKVETSTVTMRLNAGVNSQGDGEQDWDGRALPDLEFWQMDLGLVGLDIESSTLSGILGETARPVYDENGREIMKGFEAFRGTVEDYRVSSALDGHFALLDKTRE